jgi:hypothetical protein
VASSYWKMLTWETEVKAEHVSVLQTFTAAERRQILQIRFCKLIYLAEN